MFHHSLLRPGFWITLIKGSISVIVYFYIKKGKTDILLQSPNIEPNLYTFTSFFFVRRRGGEAAVLLKLKRALNCYNILQRFVCKFSYLVLVYCLSLEPTGSSVPSFRSSVYGNIGCKESNATLKFSHKLKPWNCSELFQAYTYTSWSS